MLDLIETPGVVKDMLGVVLFEWNDNWWRGAPISLCGEATPFLHQPCAYMVGGGKLETETAAEFLGLSEQFDYMGKHCLGHRDVLFQVCQRWNGAPPPLAVLSGFGVVLAASVRHGGICVG